MSNRELALEQLEAILKERPHTALAVSQRLGCLKPTAYARIAALARRGKQLTVEKVREGKHGPLSDAYSIAA